MTLLDEVKQAKSIHKSAILSKPNVVGVGVGYKTSGKSISSELSVVVLVRQKVPLAGLQPNEIVPQELQGVRTDVMEVGDLRSLWVRTNRWRPAPAGVSLGHYKVTAGTFGCVVRDKTSGERLILSNNHVLANGNEAQVGDPILQPAPADGGGTANDIIARLERFYPIRFTTAPASCNIAQSYAKFGNFLAQMMKSQHQVQAFQAAPGAVNLIDAALARPIENAAILDEILEIGAISGVRQANLGMLVRKSGRTTAFTTGEISVLDATVTIGYGPDRSATFEQQIVTRAMSSGGDSGALLVDAGSQNAVGLLFGGSDQASIFNPIQAVLDQLNVEFLKPVVSAKDLPPQAATKIQQVRLAYQDWLMSKANVVGVGVGLRQKQNQSTGEMALVVMVSRKLPKNELEAQDIIPSEIDGIPVDIQVVGEISAH
jgi:hypothetical protein